MMSKTNDVQKWEEREALDRFKLISPLLDESLDPAKKIELRNKIAEEKHISVRTLYRYEKAYREKEFLGLKPASRKKQLSQELPENFDFLLEEAIQLRKEVPKRSVAQIIDILEMEGHVEPDELKRSTLQRHIYNAGFGREHMKTYSDARKSSSKRFCKPNRMMLVQADIKYGPSLPIGKRGAKVKTYLSSVIDDHSRFILFSRFYTSQEEIVIEDSFHQAILRYGRFDSCYLDNGTQYIGRQLKDSLSRLGIRIRHTPKRSGKSKGKVEKFHQAVDKFLREAKLKNVKSLDELNRLWWIYLEEYYHKEPHEGISEYYESLGAAIPEKGISPRQEWNRDSRPLTYIDVNVVSEAFLHHEKRKVDKGACISFHGKKYETKPALIGHMVEISYDPISADTITVMYPGFEPFTAQPLRIGEFCDKYPTLPASMQEQKPTTSRFMDALERRYKETSSAMADAISFEGYRKESEDHV